MRLKALALLLFPAIAVAQVSYVPVTATVVDPNGNPYAYAQVTATLVSAQGTPLTSGVFTPNGSIFNGSPVRGTLTSAGLMSLQLVPNGTLTCAPACPGNQWRITISEPTDPTIMHYGPSWNITYTTTVTGAVDLSTQISALAQPISFFNAKTGQSTLIGASFPGVSSNGQGLSMPNGAMSAQQAQGELNGALYSSPEAAIAVACTLTKAVWFPAGTYNTNGIGLTPSCDGLSIRGVPGATVFHVAAGQTGLYNANANAGTPGNGVNRIFIQNIWWDITASTSTVAWNTKGINWSDWFGNVIWASNNLIATIEDGGNWQNVNGDYGDNFRSTYIYNIGAFPWPSNTVGILVQNGSNEVRHDGGQVNRFGTNISIQSGDHNSFKNIDAENWVQNCVSLGAGAGGNIVETTVRCETDWTPWAASTPYQVGNYIVDSNGNVETVTTAGTAGTTHPTWATSLSGTTADGTGTLVWTLTTLNPSDVLIASGANNNTVSVYTSGYERGVIDNNSSASNSIAMLYGCTSCGTGNVVDILTTNNQGLQVGINKTPSQPVFGGGLDLHGWFQFDGNLYSLTNSLSNSTFNWYGQTVAGGTQSQFAWFSYVSTNGGTDSMTFRSNGSINFQSSGGTSFMAYVPSFFGWQTYGYFTPNAANAGAFTVGTVALPWNGFIFGPAANETVSMTCAACTANRTEVFPNGNSQPVLVASLTTTAATSDPVTIQGMTSSGHCSAPGPTNSSAAAATTAWVSAKNTNQITVTHAATAGMTYDLVCTAN